MQSAAQPVGADEIQHRIEASVARRPRVAVDLLASSHRAVLQGRAMLDVVPAEQT
jgi:hypothetical protein